MLKLALSALFALAVATGATAAHAEGCRPNQECGGPGGSGGVGLPTGPVPVRRSHFTIDPVKVDLYLTHQTMDEILQIGADESEVLGIFTAINGDAPATAIWLGQMAGLTSSHFNDMIKSDYGNGIVIHFWFAFGGFFSWDAW
jgi:hypothetical protein